MNTYTIIDINGQKHVILAEDITTVCIDKTNDTAIKFWNYINGERVCTTFFNFRNIISISETYVNDVEIEEISDSMVEPNCKIDIAPLTGGHSCSTCKHKDKVITDEPCMDCTWCDKWEAKNDKTTL